MSKNNSVSLEFLRRENLEIFDKYVLEVTKNSKADMRDADYEDLDLVAKRIVYLASRIAAHREHFERVIIEREMWSEPEEEEEPGDEC